jgi:DNA-binding transcriptional ArsR family regulator
VNAIRPLVYRIVWQDGTEQLHTGVEMLEKGITFLNSECDIYEYEHVSEIDRAVREQLNQVYLAAYTLATSMPDDVAPVHLKRLKEALDTYHAVANIKPLV